MNDYSYDNPFVLQATVVENADVEQEVALLELQGFKVSRHIVRLRLAQENRGLVFQGDPGSMAEPIAVNRMAPRAVVEQLIEWATEQDHDLARQVLDFIAEPDEELLNAIVLRLKRAKLVSTDQPTDRPAGTLSAVLTTYIRQKPRTKEELYDYARTLHQAERPEAAVRQFLRRAVRTNVLKLENELYSIA